MLLSLEMAELLHYEQKWTIYKNVYQGGQNIFFWILKNDFILVVQFTFESYAYTQYFAYTQIGQKLRLNVLNF